MVDLSLTPEIVIPFIHVSARPTAETAPWSLGLSAGLSTSGGPTMTISDTDAAQPGGASLQGPNDGTGKPDLRASGPLRKELLEREGKA